MSHRALSHAEFAAQGGGSRRFTDETPGPEHGYYVSDHPQDKGEYKVERAATPVDVAFHFSHNRERVLSTSARPHEVYQGLWQDRDANGHVTSYLDVSRHTNNRRAAVARGFANDQVSIYDANQGKSLYLDKEGTASTSTPAPTSTKPVRAQTFYKAANNSEGVPEWA